MVNLQLKSIGAREIRLGAVRKEKIQT